MIEVLFFVGAIGAIAGAIGVIALSNPFYSVLALVVHLVSLSLLFLLLEAQFVAAAQVIVYAGAVMVLYVFVVAYVGGQDEPVRPPSRLLNMLAPLFGAILFVELCMATLGAGLQAIDSEGASLGANYGEPSQIGRLLLTKFLLPFELASFLLLVAAVGAVILARRRRGLELPSEDRRPLDLPRPMSTGTTAEAVGGAGGAAELEPAGPTREGGW
ncbi:MAG: NADH-quinone oxidoreductase subunit J [Solirubrobacteraceae bacterium]